MPVVLKLSGLSCLTVLLNLIAQKHEFEGFFFFTCYRDVLNIVLILPLHLFSVNQIKLRFPVSHWSTVNIA